MKIIPILTLALFLAIDGFSQSVENGEKLFSTNCKACHTIGDGKRVGPDLANLLDRREKDWVFKFVTNSTELINSGDEQAVAIFEEFNKMPMPPQSFSDDQLDDLVSYIDSYEAPVAAEEAPVEAAEANVQEVEAAAMPTWVKVIFGSFAFTIVGLLILIAFLYKMVRSFG